MPDNRLIQEERDEQASRHRQHVQDQPQTLLFSEVQKRSSSISST